MNKHSLAKLFFMLNFNTTAALITVLPANAIPDFTRTVGLSEPLSITLYHDNIDPNQYWAPPTTLEYALQSDNKTPVFSLTHYGIKKPSISGGMGAVLTVSVRPMIDQKLLPKQWEDIKKNNPAARISVISPDIAFMDLILGSALFDKSAGAQVKSTIKRTEASKAKASLPAAAQAATPPSEIVVEDLTGVVTSSDEGVTIISDPSVASSTAGAQVGAYQVFAVSLTPDAGAVFATNGGEDSAPFGVRYRYVMSGVRTRIKAEITVNWRRLYEYTRTEAGGGWFFAKARYSREVQKLQETGAVKLNIIEGAFESDADAFETIYNTLVKAQIDGQGIFKPTLTASPPPGAPATSGTFLGWSFSGGVSSQQLEEKKDFTFSIDRQIIGKKSFAIGMGFQGMCSKFPSLFVAQGVSGPGCIEESDISAAAQRYKELNAACEAKQQTQRSSLFQTIGVLPNIDLQKIALNNAFEALAQSKFECLQGK